jgi:hypothetical protein
MTTQKVARALATLSLPKPVPALINVAKAIVTAMSGNPSFPSPDPPLPTVTASINDLEVAEAGALARTRGAATTRNEKRVVLVTQLQQLKGSVQKVADANIENAASLIESAAMAVRKTSARKKRVFAATPGAVSGSVKLVAESAARRASYEWQSSSDGGKTWQMLPVTLQAKTIALGLASGSTVSFRFRGVTKAGEADWSQPISILVQ